MYVRDGGELEILAEKYGGLFLDEDDLFTLREQVRLAREALDRHDLGAVRKALEAAERMVE